MSFKRKTRDLSSKKTDQSGKLWLISCRSIPTTIVFWRAGKQNCRDIRAVDEAEFIKRYWDGRVFGNTELEKGRNVPVKTGVVQFGLGLSVAPIRIERMTTTNPPVEGDKKAGMAPLAYRIVEHGVYCMPVLHESDGSV